MSRRNQVKENAEMHIRKNIKLMELKNLSPINQISCYRNWFIIQYYCVKNDSHNL